MYEFLFVGVVSVRTQSTSESIKKYFCQCYCCSHRDNSNGLHWISVFLSFYQTYFYSSRGRGFLFNRIHSSGVNIPFQKEKRKMSRSCKPVLWDSFRLHNKISIRFWSRSQFFLSVSFYLNLSLTLFLSFNISLPI